MGTFTKILLIRNDSTFDVRLEHNEVGLWTNVPGNGGTASYSQRVPWAVDETQFNQRHLAVRVIRPNDVDIVHALWQRDVAGGNHVRHSRSTEIGVWADPGNPVSGDSADGGDRVLFIAGPESIQLTKAG